MATWGNLTRYGEYEIVGAAAQKPKLLGKGSFGKTYEAFRADKLLGGTVTESVALKVLDPRLLTTEAKRFQFIQEVTALSRFKHANLIHYLRGGEQDGEVYYAMDLCRGGDLRKLAQRYGPLPERVLAHIALQVSAGLKEVHQRHRMVHRDLKPENIVLVDEIEAAITREQLGNFFAEREDLCRIVDFGLVDFAKPEPDSGRPFAGSPMYASPEQLREQPVDGRADVYSLGMTLWFLAQGKGPLFSADGKEATDYAQIIALHVAPESHEPSLPATLSPQFRELLARLLEKRPDNRYTAAEAHAALREYLLSAPAPPPKVEIFPLTRVEGPLAERYEVGASLSKASAWNSYRATRKTTKENVRLTVAVTIDSARNAALAETTATSLCELAQLTCNPALPAPFLHVQDILFAKDYLVYVEELVPHITLSDVLRSRAQSKNHMRLSEALVLLRPVAEALDFLLQNGRTHLPMHADEIWLTSGGSGAPDPGQAGRPLDEWKQFQVRFSLMHRQPQEGSDSGYDQTIASLSDLPVDLHPTVTFCCLVYRILTGAEIAAAAHYSPNAYANAVRLRPDSNNLLRDLLCKNETARSVTEILKKLCGFEGIPWVASAAPSKTATASARSNPARSGTHLGSSVSEESRGPSQAERERICEVVSAGVVRSPYDTEGRTQVVPAEMWRESNRIRCEFTLKYFRLPKRLDLLIGRVAKPGWVESPYAIGDMQRVPWREWFPNSQVVSETNGKRFELPSELQYLEAIVVPDEPGRVVSPYDSGRVVDVAPADWIPKAEITCPTTGVPFFLPADLPAPYGIADAAVPGVLRSPYSETTTMPLDVSQWLAGTKVKLPGTQMELRTPAEVDQWEIRPKVLSASERTVEDPFRAGGTVTVPANSWQPGAVFQHPRHARRLTLPADLPPLEARLVNDRDGFAISPFTDRAFEVPREQWTPGATVKCPETNLEFQLPATLPTLLAECELVDGPRGKVRSPHDGTEFVVEPAKWVAGGVVECPTTHESFRLPRTLPELVATVDPAQPGRALSPFSGQWQDVPDNGWVARRVLTCEQTQRSFRMPEALPEWVKPAQFVPRKPGRLRSPYAPYPTIDVQPSQWDPHAVMQCPSTKRRFRFPEMPLFPSLDVETDVFNHAIRYPEDSAMEAARKQMRPGRIITYALVESIWKRHQLTTPQERLAARAEVSQGQTSAPMTASGNTAARSATGSVAGSASASAATGSASRSSAPAPATPTRSAPAQPAPQPKQQPQTPAQPVPKPTAPITAAKVPPMPVIPPVPSRAQVPATKPAEPKKPAVTGSNGAPTAANPSTGAPAKGPSVAKMLIVGGLIFFVLFVLGAAGIIYVIFNHPEFVGLK